jgi:hypothetical protein
MSDITTSKLFEKLKIYKNFSNECIFFKYIFDAEDLSSEDSKKPADDSDTFKPEYTHQIFGDEEVEALCLLFYFLRILKLLVFYLDNIRLKKSKK